MTASASSPADPTLPCFRLKGGMFPLTVLDINHFDIPQFTRELEAKVAEAPAFFQQAPVILNVEAVEQKDTLPLAELAELCRQFGLIPVGLRGASEALQAQARTLGMAMMAEGRQRPAAATSAAEPAPQPAPEPTAAVVTSSTDACDETPVSAAAASEEAAIEPAATEQQPARVTSTARPSKIITTPIRSGQQVYAPGGDLIVLAAVSAGAEILADGNIHVYGPLRGRALAGVQGDTNARIFCQSLEAELISIAGHFKLDEDFRKDHWKQAVSITLNEQSLTLEPLL